MLNNADSAEVLPIFRPQDFLSEFRLTIAEDKTRTHGPVKLAYEEDIEAICHEAEEMAELHLGKLARLPALEGLDEQYSNRYRETYVDLARRLGIASIRLESKGNNVFAETLRQPEKRKSVLRRLAIDYRRTSFLLMDENPREIGISHLHHSAALYNTPAQLTDTRDRYVALGRSAFVKAIKSSPTDPERFLARVEAKIDSLMSESKYAGLGIGTVKQAVLNNSYTPEANLDNFIEMIEKFMSVQKYADFGFTAVKYIVVTYGKKAENYLDKAIEKFEVLSNDPRYSDISPTLIKEAVLSRSDPEAFLSDLYTRTTELMQDPRFADLGRHIVECAVADYSNPVNHLEMITERIGSILENPTYSWLGLYFIKHAVTGYPNEPLKYLDDVVATIRRLQENPRYATAGLHLIKQAAQHNDPEMFLDETMGS